MSCFLSTTAVAMAAFVFVDCLGGARASEILSSVLRLPQLGLHLFCLLGADSCFFPEVFRGIWNGTDVASKVFLEQDLTPENMEDFCNEISIFGVNCLEMAKGGLSVVVPGGTWWPSLCLCSKMYGHISVADEFVVVASDG
ncbi:hypothetical protein DEO72_LG1g1456 [Vigna unguiculata]|uniref:Uncharacterized protein n=1 Tax=Vigna unguiculata TaxID=3917 RepID=A0A4D6KK00_VIGUN|nr:hypothetical protein DEO72_LG1g1456 [Vigna unguiculata]